MSSAPSGVGAWSSAKALASAGVALAAAGAYYALKQRKAKKKAAGVAPEEFKRVQSPLVSMVTDPANKDKAPVIRIVLTGGPCGGKTTAMGTLTERFQSHGFRVFRVPEAATMLLSGGHSFASLNKQQQYEFQAALLKLMLSLEEAFLTLARSTNKPCIVLCDRGAMDCRSYMPEDEWEQLTQEVGVSTMELRDGRYDCVIHLVTAANGASTFYTTAGHAARSEDAEYAQQLDERIKHNWVGHPHFHVIDNSTDFTGKMQRVMSTICQFVGIEDKVGTSKRKFLLNPAAIQKMADKDGGDRIIFPDEIRYCRFDVVHTYVVRPDQDKGHQLRLRRRGLGDTFIYSYTLRYPDLLGQRIELKRIIPPREYADLVKQKDPATMHVQKKRYSFLFRNQYFELDQFIEPHGGLYLLEFYADKDKPIDSEVFPPWLTIEREVTQDPNYFMYNLARDPRYTAGAASPHQRTQSMSLDGDLYNAASPQQQQLHALLQQTARLGATAPSSPAVQPLRATGPDIEALTIGQIAGAVQDVTDAATPNSTAAQ